MKCNIEKLVVEHPCICQYCEATVTLSLENFGYDNEDPDVTDLNEVVEQELEANGWAIWGECPDCQRQSAKEITEDSRRYETKLERIFE